LADGNGSARLAFQPCGFSSTPSSGRRAKTIIFPIAASSGFTSRGKSFAREEPQGRRAGPALQNSNHTWLAHTSDLGRSAIFRSAYRVGNPEGYGAGSGERFRQTCNLPLRSSTRPLMIFRLRVRLGTVFHSQLPRSLWPAAEMGSLIALLPGPSARSHARVSKGCHLQPRRVRLALAPGRLAHQIARRQAPPIKPPPRCWGRASGCRIRARWHD
jgi:hypothetical protein